MHKIRNCAIFESSYDTITSDHIFISYTHISSCVNVSIQMRCTYYIRAYDEPVYYFISYYTNQNYLCFSTWQNSFILRSLFMFIQLRVIFCVRFVTHRILVFRQKKPKVFPSNIVISNGGVIRISFIKHDKKYDYFYFVDVCK